MPQERTVPQRLIDEFEARLREVELVVGARIMASWAEAADVSLEEARLLLLLAAARGTMHARDLAGLSGIPIDDVYPALQRLAQRGDVREERRAYSLTDAGERSVASLSSARREGIEAYVAGLPATERRRLEAALGFDLPDD
jgi:DNA-binding MarR family transcriptional regulator